PTGLKRIKNIFRILKDFYQIESDKFEIDFCLARGLAYYTSTVFEIKLTDEIGSVSGGGRYDNLTDIYGKKVFAVGISFGLERLLYLLDKDKEQKIEDEEGVFLAWMEESCYKNALQLAKKLRQDGFIVSCNISSKKDLKEQIAYASKKEFKYLIIIGRKEVEKNCYTLKDLREKKQYEQLNYNELIEKLGKKNEKNKTRACC
ncbi:MAG: His/Gly/Thr/Pro-type tRNA ligase C-terminal domain-containing protein, partial [Candidatus Micrarchaeota archaeon]|nr:His/Gly/Thr/Pro-type tRNA ligase C-terminal domain-containing protein [Candidatus Micrarchaeota archaeon]